MKNYFRFVVFALLGLLNAQWASAQTVTVSPTTGKLVAASTYEGEVGFENGWSSLWRHEQLPLSFSVADDDQLTLGGEISNPAGNINVIGNNLVLMGGMNPDLYCVLSLPKGYRFKKYKIVLLNNLIGTNVGEDQTIASGGTKVMYETDNTYNTSNFKANTNEMGGTNSSTEYVLERTSLVKSDMSNQLYFRITHTNAQFYGVTIKSFEVEFTAEGEFDAEVAPYEIGPATSLVEAPFLTSKMDIGAVQPQTKNGKTYYAYNYLNVQDMEAFTYLYQDDAITDGHPSSTASTQKNITPVSVDGNMRYALKNDIYYIESPVEIHSQTGLASPIGYRITGAHFECLWSNTTVPSGTKTFNACEISYTNNGQTYYLNGELQFTTESFSWEIDDMGNLCNGKRFLACHGERDVRDLSYSTIKDNQYNLRRDTDGKIYYTSSSNTKYYLQWYNGTYATTYQNREYYRWDGDYATIGPKMVKSTNTYSSRDYESFNFGSYWNPNYVRCYGCYRSNYTATSTYHEGREIEYGGFTPGSYTLKVYDKTGTSVVFSKTVSSAADLAGDAGKFDLTGLNNDAVKFAIEGLTGNNQALISVTLTMETLNPYINKIDIFAQDASETLKLTQTFTANDFSVSGGAFKFYIPTDYSTSDIHFSFRDLYSNDGDETYIDSENKPGTGHARYSFVSSPYFQAFDEVKGNSTTQIEGAGYDMVDTQSDEGLYDTRYSADIPSPTKLYANVVGNIRFKFNNAENLSNTSGATEKDYLVEYPFSAPAYLLSTDPDAEEGEEAATGAFEELVLNAQDEATRSDIVYLFTADETRYNIAPSKKWQHRSYAFYRMDIELEAARYNADLAWTKLYDHTCYADKDKNNKDVDADKSMWGLKLGTKDENGNKVEGYLSAGEIAQAVAASFTSTGTNHPTSQDQILYVDASDLKTVVSSQDEDGNPFTIENLNAMFAPNSLFFLPKNMTSTANNIAYKTSSGSYNAARNIVLVDRKPFYSPYDIQVGAAPNYAMYTREITWQSQGRNSLATVILPFTIAVTEDGVHTEPAASPYSGCTFTVNKMNSDNCMSVDQAVDTEARDFYATGYFTPITGVKEVDANKPYMIKVTTPPSDENVPFAVTQYGALVKATTDMTKDTGTADNPTPDRYTFKGESATGKIVTSGISFQNYGSFSGKKLTANSGYFYFAGGKYLNSKNIRPEVSQYLYMYPFRGYYTYTGGGTGNAKMMLGFDVVFGENTTTGIADLTDEAVADLVAIPGRGSITFKASADNDVQIVKANGMAAGRVLISAGETKTINIPAGLYIVNGAKLIVK